MTQNPGDDALIATIAEAEKATEAGDRRRAASLYFEASKSCAGLVGQPDISPSREFLDMGVHYFEAAAHRCLYNAARDEDEPQSIREDHADSLIRSARAAIACLRVMQHHAKMLEAAYGMLIDGFDYLMASRTDLNGMAEAGRRMEATLDEYRKLVSPAEFQRVFPRLLHARAMTNMTEAIKCLFHDRNYQASQQCFKRAQEFAEQIAKAATDDLERSGARGFIELLKAFSSLGEAMALQEKGAYLAAAAKMKDAEPGLKASPLPAAIALSLWAKAAQPYYRAMNDEVEGADDAAIRGYEQASKAFVVAADAFPATSADFASMGSWVRFYAESSRERAKSVVTRKGWRQRQQAKAQRQAGLIFFGLWLIAIAATVAALQILKLTIDTYSFLLLMFVCFLTAGVAAALIKAEVALRMFSSALRSDKTADGKQ
jgi:hypothetical protein